MPDEEDFDEIEEMQRKLKEREEDLPDLPNIVAALEDKLTEFRDMEDYTALTKYDLAVNIEIIFDMLADLAKYMVIKAYTVDILDKIVASRTTKIFGSDEEKAEKEEQEKKDKEQQEESIKRSEHFYL